MKPSPAEPYVQRTREPRVTSLIVSIVLHTLAVVGIMGSSWLWGASAFKPVSPYTVSLVGAPLSLKQPSPASSPKRPSKPSPPPKSPPKPTVKSSKLDPAEPAAKVPVPKPSPKKPAPRPKAPEAKAPIKPAPAPKPSAQSKPVAKPAPAKPVATKPKPSKKPPPPVAKPKPPPSATSSEARSAVEALRKRQAAERLKQQQAEAAKQQAAERVAALRDQVAIESSGGPDAGQVAGLSQIRLSVYQKRVRTEIINAWILPLPPAESRDLQATAFFQVLRDGRVEKLNLVQPSGNPLFDDSLMRAIQRVSPLPALPTDYPGEVLEVEMRFQARES